MKSKAQDELMRSLGLPTSVDGLGDDELIRIEEKLADELLYRGINSAGDGLNEYGRLCRETIEALPD